MLCYVIVQYISGIMPGCSAPKCTNSYAKGVRLFHFPANEVINSWS